MILGSIPLSLKLRPKSLSDVFGQKDVVRYFSSLVKRPEAGVRNYTIVGDYGTGKTSIARAFASDLLGVDSIEDCPSYMEFDSFQISDRSVYNRIKDYVFQPARGWKVVVFDEFHLVPKDVQAGMLKDIEESTEIFFFFLSTEFDGILETILSRCHVFTLTKFPASLLREYLDLILASESIQVSDRVKEMVIMQSRGHLRDLLNKLQAALFQGEESYIESYVDTISLFERYFREKGSGVISIMESIPAAYLRSDLSFFMKEYIIKRKEIFQESVIPKIFMFYLKFIRLVESDNDFFSFLYSFKEYIEGMNVKQR